MTKTYLIVLMVNAQLSSEENVGQGDSICHQVNYSSLAIKWPGP